MTPSITAWPPTRISSSLEFSAQEVAVSMRCFKYVKRKSLCLDYVVFSVFLYFLLNRSTRPAVSISFCLPVKNGWHFEQISRWISGFVERVLNVSPQAHFTTAST